MFKINKHISKSIQDSASSNHRSLIILDEKSKKLIPLLTHLVKKKLNAGCDFKVLWLIKRNQQKKTYKEEKKLAKALKYGNLEVNKENVYDLFLLTTNIKYCFFHDSKQILGQTFNICIIENVECITPNVLAQSMETVCGGGIIIFIMPSFDISKLSMEVHSKMLSNLFSKVYHRFNKRFLFKLTECESCFVLESDKCYTTNRIESKLNNSNLILVNKSKNVTPLVETLENTKINLKTDKKRKKNKMIEIFNFTENFNDLNNFINVNNSEEKNKNNLNINSEKFPVNYPKIGFLHSKDLNLFKKLATCCKSSDQLNILSKIVDICNDFVPSILNYQIILSLTSGRGRGKSASMGISLVAMLFLSKFTNVYITSPCIENTIVLFQIIRLSLNALDLKEGYDYICSKIKIGEMEYVNKIVLLGLNYQSLQFQSCSEIEKLNQCSILCIDEVAAIPINVVKKLLTLAPFVIMASTIQGYEGTGRSLSLKLLNNLRKSSENHKDIHRNKFYCSNLSNMELIKKKFKKPKYSSDGKIETNLLNENNIYKLNKFNDSHFLSTSIKDINLLSLETNKLNNTIDSSSKESLKINSDNLKKNTNHSVFDHFEENKLDRKIILHEFCLNQCIRYCDGDPIENWINNLLCLNVKEMAIDLYPKPEECGLFYIDQSKLFSGKPIAEKVLENIVSIYVSSHYKNSPDDLQMLSDCPSHHLFCLLSTELYQNKIPNIITVIQVSIEGGMSDEELNLKSNNLPGKVYYGPAGNLMPWMLFTQFNCEDLAKMIGMRIIRIATHSSYQKMGYGQRALKLLEEFCKNNSDYNEQICAHLPSLSFISNDDRILIKEQKDTEKAHKKYKKCYLDGLFVDLKNKLLKEHFDYIGVSFGSEKSLIRFWRNFNMKAVYLSQVPNETTGEHSCLMMKFLDNKLNDTKLVNIWKDFRRRIIRLLPHDFKNFNPFSIANFILEEKKTSRLNEKSEIELKLARSDLKRLKKFLSKTCEFRLIKDIFHFISSSLLSKSLATMNFNLIQMILLISHGMQDKNFKTIQQEFNDENIEIKSGNILNNIEQILFKVVNKHLKNK